MNNIDLYIQELETSKVEIKEAIIAKGVTPTGGLSSYAAAINDIEGSGGPIETDDLGVLINENGSYYYTPEGDGFTSVSVTVDVIPPPVITQEKDVTITSNGETIVTPDSGFDGLNKVNINVEVPIPTFETETLTVELTENGTYNYTPEKDGYSSVEVNVDVVGSGGSGLVVPFEEIGYPSELKNEVNNYLNSKPLSDLEYSKSLYNKWAPSKYTAYQLYINDKKLVYAPNIDTSNVTNMYGMFQNCSSLTTVPLLNTSKVTNIGYMFYGCPFLTTVPLFDTSKVTSTTYMFYNCSSLTTIPQLNTSNVTNMKNMFYGCSKLTDVPIFDTIKVTDMQYMFYNCSSLTTIPQLNTSKVTSTAYMFHGCSKLTDVPIFDTIKVTNMQFMFYNCSSLTTIPQLNTSKVTNMQYTFAECTSLVTVPLFDTSSVTSITYMFGSNNLTKLTDIGGFKNLGAKSTLSLNNNYNFNMAPNMTYESAMNIINNLYDRASAGYSVVKLKFATNTIALLSADDIAIATNKGWTLTT